MLITLGSMPAWGQAAAATSGSQILLKVGQSSTNSEVFQDKAQPYAGLDLRLLPVSFLNGAVHQTFGFEIGGSRQKLSSDNTMFSEQAEELAVSYWAMKANFCAGTQLPVSLCWGIHFNHRRFSGDGIAVAMAGSSQDLALQYAPADGWVMQLGKDVGDTYRMKFKDVDVKASDRKYFLSVGKSF